MKKYSAVKELERTKEKFSMYNMLNSCPTQREVLLKMLYHAKQSTCTNTQKVKSPQVIIAKALPTIFKDKTWVPHFLLNI